MSFQFNQTALKAWVALCEEETRLKNENASAEILADIKMRIAMGLVALIQEAQGPATNVEVDVEADVEDPATN